MERIKGMLERVGQARLTMALETARPEPGGMSSNVETDFEAVVASEGVRKAADRSRSHGSPPVPSSSSLSPSPPSSSSPQHSARSAAAAGLPFLHAYVTAPIS